MRELRTQSGGRPFRTLYAFDPRRSAILLIGGDKTGNDRWYDEFVPVADRLYDEYLEQLRKRGKDKMRTRKFSELTKDWSPERRERVAKRVRETLGTMHLEGLRKAHAMTQTKLAETLGVAQSEISKIEHRTDLYISTLAQYVQALGGELEIRAIFPEAEVKITQFEDLPKAV